MDPIERLTKLFERFPGIGPRQADRFVHFLLRSSPSFRSEVADAVSGLAASVSQCPSCMRYHTGETEICAICSSPARDASFLAVVASDADLAALERSGTYRGHYFVLGGTISLATEKKSGIRLEALLSRIARGAREGLTEVILALPANPEGDFTTRRVRDECQEVVPSNIHITVLGRGLSTGSELEYADPETLKSALANRR